MERIGSLAGEWLDACPFGLAHLDRDLRVTRANAAFAERAGQSVDAVVGRSVMEILSWLGPPLGIMLRTTLESGHALMDVEMGGGPAAPRRVRVSAFSMPSGVGLILADSAGEIGALRDRAALFHAIFDHAAIGILAFEWCGQGTWTNPAFTRLLGYSQEDLARLGVQGISHPDDFQTDLALFQKLMRREIDHYELAKRYLRKDGSVLWAHLVVSLARDAEGAPQLIIAMIEDVTDKMRADEERQRLIRELEQAVRTRDVFLAVASHELKTPVTSLQLRLQALVRKLAKGSSPVPEELDAALRQTARLTDLVEDLLDVSQLSEGRLALEPAPFDLVGAVREVIDRHRPVAEREGCEVSLIAEAATLVLYGDRARLERVFDNLIANAIKFGTGEPIQVSVKGDHDVVHVTVSDRGIGIAVDDQERIFQPFQRAVSEMHYGGLGLGLYIARHLVVAHGGRILVDSKPGKGARFTVDLPQRSGPPLRAGAPTRPASKGIRSR